MNDTSWFVEYLVCPRDKLRLSVESGALACPDGHCYPVVNGVPVMLLGDVDQTQAVATSSLRAATSPQQEPFRIPEKDSGVDPFVEDVIGATGGIMYSPLIGKLKEYPIPHLRAPGSAGGLFLDIGCNWGRWCIAACRLGYQAVGIDHNLEAVLCAKRVAEQLNMPALYLVADARYLPFPERSFDMVFSYSVLQHFDKDDVRRSLLEIRKVLGAKGTAMVQMPNMFGLRCLYHQARRGFREAREFEVRYWTPSELNIAFSDLIGPTRLFVDGYFSLNAQTSDVPLMPRRYRLVIHFSEYLRKLADRLPILLSVADSLYVTACRND